MEPGVPHFRSTRFPDPVRRVRPALPEHLDPEEAERPAPALDRPWHYLVVDAKFTKLKLGKGRKRLRAGGSSNAYAGQLFIYNAALGRLQGYVPPRAFLLGRGYHHEYTRKKRKFECSSDIATERLGPVPMDDGLREKVTAAAEWTRRLRCEGEGWSPLPEPSVLELRPPRAPAAPWRNAIREIATQPDASGPEVQPARVTAAEEVWRPRPPLEFFVDFETVSDLQDDFSTFPKAGGQAMIFMIGCGHLEDGAWQFRCFVAERLDAASERRIVEAWLGHLDALHRRFQVARPRVFHWSGAEVSNLRSARGRHPEKEWLDPNWFDLHKSVFKAEPILVRGAHGFGLKTVAKALHAHGLTETSWGDSKVDGQGAMVGAWRCDAQARRDGVRLVDTELMKEIQEYNEVDCRVMQKILDYLRANH